MCSYEYIKYIIHYRGWGLACFVSVHIPIPLHAALIKCDPPREKVPLGAKNNF